jgi:hypothetical protein
MDSDRLKSDMIEHVHRLALADQSFSLVTMHSIARYDYRSYWSRVYASQQQLPELYRVELHHACDSRNENKNKNHPTTTCMPQWICDALAQLYEYTSRYFSPVALNFFLIDDVQLNRGHELVLVAHLGRGAPWARLPVSHVRQYWYRNPMDPNAHQLWQRATPPYNRFQRVACDLLYDEQMTPRILQHHHSFGVR